MVPCSLPVLPRRFFWGEGAGTRNNFDFRACCIFVARAAPCHLQIWSAHHHFKSLSPLCYTLPPAQSCFEAEKREREREGVGAHGLRPIPSTPSKEVFISTICGKNQNCFNTLCAIRSDFSMGFLHILYQRSPLHVVSFLQICFHATLAYF